MSWGILEVTDPYNHLAGACLYDAVTMTAFGPIVRGDDPITRLASFVQWVGADFDPRSFTAAQLEDAWGRYPYRSDLPRTWSPRPWAPPPLAYASDVAHGPTIGPATKRQRPARTADLPGPAPLFPFWDPAWVSRSATLARASNPTTGGAMHTVKVTTTATDNPTDHHVLLNDVSSDDLARWNAERTVTWGVVPDDRGNFSAFLTVIPFEAVVRIDVLN